MYSLILNNGQTNCDRKRTYSVTEQCHEKGQELQQHTSLLQVNITSTKFDKTQTHTKEILLNIFAACIYI